MKELYLFCQRSGAVEVEKRAEAIQVSVMKLLEALFDRCMESDRDCFETIRSILVDGVNLELWQKPIGMDNSTAVALAERLTEMFRNANAIVKRNFNVVMILSEMETQGVCIDVLAYERELKSMEDEFTDAIGIVRTSCEKHGVNYKEEMIAETFTSSITELNNAVKKAYKCKMRLHILKLCEREISEGYLKSNWNFFGSRTGRITSSKCNIQGLPKRIRESCIVPRDSNHVLIRADYVSQELFLAGIMLQQQEMVSKLQSGADLHREIASNLFSVSMPDVSAEMRKFAKSVAFAILYGASIHCVQDIMRRTEYIDITLTADDVYYKVKSYFKGIDEMLNQYARDGYVVFINGKRVSIGEAGKRYQWLNFVIQSSAAVILKSVMATLEEMMPEECRILYVVHDEIVVEAPFDVKEQIKEMLGAVMSEVLFQYGMKIKLPVDITD